MMRHVSPLEQARLSYAPRVPEFLGRADLLVREGAPTRALADEREIAERFPLTYGRPVLELVAGAGAHAPRRLCAGVVLSGGQAPGGHNVIAGLYDGLAAADPSSRLLGFLDGPRGILDERTIELTRDRLDAYRNTGGFDLLGSGRDKIETREQLLACEAACVRLQLDGLVIVGGDDSNTNAALLAEHFLERGSSITVLGVPKTIDGDLRGEWVELPFGFDTATKVYSELIGNIGRDVKSARKYWHFIRLMGRSASHVTLECALATHPNVALIGEEVQEQGLRWSEIVDQVAEVVRRRAASGKSFGVCLVPEGLIEFVPEMRALIGRIDGVLSSAAAAFERLGTDREREAFVEQRLAREEAAVFTALPAQIRRQMLLDRDAHGNVQVSLIDTELLLSQHVAERVTGRFATHRHFFGYEGRAAAPTNFDCDYGYGLGRVAAGLAATRSTGYLCSLINLAAPRERWRALGVPLTSLMAVETRKGRRTPVIRKALVRLDGAAFRELAGARRRWEVEDDYLYPGAIQYFGPPAVADRPPATLQLEHPTLR